MEISSLNTTVLRGGLALADPVNPNDAAPTSVVDEGTVSIVDNDSELSFLGQVSLPAGATITDLEIYTTGTGSLWSDTPSWKVSITTDGTMPTTGNLVNGVSSTISAFGEVQELSKSSWVTYGNGVNVAQNSVAYLYTASGDFAIPDTANVVFRVYYYLTP